MIDPQLGIDTWEGQLEIDEAVLQANDVKFMFIRLNSISGGHHKDDLFDQQWAEAAGFHRAPYFVYNPWVTGQQNFDWLLANMPPDAKAVAADIEVKKDGLSPTTYAKEVDKFITLCLNQWKYITYTGEWFLQFLSYWRTDVPYWWAQYPLDFYSPGSPQQMTWDELRKKLEPFDFPFNQSKIPGPLFCWQISGDTLILPGNSHIMDLNIFYKDLNEFFGTVETQPPSNGGNDMDADIIDFINIRPQAGDLSTDLGDLYKGDKITYSEKQNVTSGQFNGDWYHITSIMRLSGQKIVAPSNWWCWGKNVLEVTSPPPTTSKPKFEIAFDPNEVEVILKPQ